MTDDADQLLADPGDNGGLANVWRWAIAGGVVAILLIALWVMNNFNGTQVTQSASAADALQLSFQQYKAGQYQDAVASSKAAIAANPESADAYNNLAVSYMALRLYDEAIQAAQDAIRVKPDYQLAKNNLAWIQREKAKATGTPVQATPSGPTSTLLNQSVQHYQAGRFRECIDTATQAAKLNPKSAQAFNNVGICAGNLQLWDAALRNTQEAIRLDPNFQLAKNNLAWIQQQRLRAGGSTIP
jgi:tetratricopeptide (TPR) repeat protein